MADSSTDDNKTPEDLEAEIAATARALGGKSPKEKKVAQSSEEPDVVELTDESAEDATEESTPESAAVSSEPEPEEAAKPETEDEDEDQGEKLTVTIKKKEAATPPPDEPEAEKEPEKPAVIKHSGKKIAPLSEQVKPSDESSTEEAAVEQDANQTTDDSTDKAEPVNEPQDEPEEAKPDDSEQEADSSEEDQTEASRKLAAMSGELRAREAQKANTANSDEQQTAKVYDTKKYHLPIKAGRHHRRSGFPKWLQIAILLFVLAGSVYYVWANDLIPSFSGPSETAVTQTDEQGAVGLQNQTGVSVLHLVPGIENIGTAVAELTYAPSPNEQSEYISIVMPFIQNKAGAIWFEQPTLAVQLVNEYLSENAVAEDELVESKVAADFIDIYGYAPLLADNGSQSLKSALDGLEGAAAVECQAAIDSANVALVGDLRLQQSLNKTGISSGEVTYRGQTIPVETFTLEGDALAQARTLVEAAIEKCLSENERAEAEQYLRDGSQVRYRVSTDAQYLYVDATDTQSNRLIFRAFLSGSTDIKSSQVPQLINTVFHPLTRLTSITAACGEIPEQLDTSSADSLKLISSTDDAYLSVAPFDVPLVCNVDEASLNELPRAESIELVYDTSTYVTLIEMLRGDVGFPSPSELTIALQEIDSSIPTPDGEQIFYSPQPEGCAEDEQENCTLYVLDIAP